MKRISIRKDELLDLLSLLRMMEKAGDAIPSDIRWRARELNLALSKEIP